MNRYRMLQAKLKELKAQGKVEKSFKCNQKETVLEERYQQAINDEHTLRGYVHHDMDILDERSDEAKDREQAFLESLTNPTPMVFA
jgi:hypothetical protein